ncbi:MAG TPA: DUF167 family protein [Xanthobacteraceae bacterium]|nr:DUF167 family protein [Xanthobacteraceae bacterium]
MPGGLLVSVRATPKGGRDAIDGIERLADGRAVLKARVRAVPADGEANAALQRVIAEAAGVAPSTVSLARGAQSRTKTFRLAGDPRLLAAAFERAITKNAKAK